MEITDEGAVNLMTKTNTIVWSDSMMPQNIWTGVAKNTLKQGDKLNAQQFLRSENQRFAAILKDDLSLVVYMKKQDGTNLEIYNNDLKTTGQSLGTLTVSTSGEVVVTDTTNTKNVFTSPSTKSGTPLELRIQDNGQLVSLNGEMDPLWATPACTVVQQTEADVPLEVDSPFTAKLGLFLRSPSKKCLMSIEDNGAITLKDDTGKLFW